MRHWRLGGKPRHRPAHAMPTAWYPRWPQVAAAAVVPAAAFLALIGNQQAPAVQHPSAAKVAGAATDQAGAEHDLALVGASSADSSVTGPDTTVPGADPAVVLPAASSIAAPGATSALAGDGIPQTALSAYENAATLADAQYPACRIPWPLLAGIGRVESDHGRFGGAVLYADGTSSRPIIGIPLDGSRSARITDTDQGRLDGDPVFDRAVGPMQFIPSTWLAYGADGNGDGKADPFNIFDAARAAADYLCVAGGDLSTLAGQTRAVLAYNHSSAYLAEVLGLERTYAAGVVGLVIPVGPAAPTPSSTPTLMPVDPGPPLGSGGQQPPTSSNPAPGTSAATSSGATPSGSSSQPSFPGSSSGSSGGGSGSASASGSGSGSGSTSGSGSGSTSGSPSGSASGSTSDCPSPSDTSTSADPSDSPTSDVPSTDPVSEQATYPAPPSMPVVDPAVDPQSADDTSTSASSTPSPTC